MSFFLNPYLFAAIGGGLSYFFATGDGSGNDISDAGGVHSAGTFTIPSAWNGRKVRVSGTYRKEAGGNVVFEVSKGGGGIPGLPKSSCETNSNDESMSVHSAPIVVATGDTFTTTQSVSIGTGNGNTRGIQVLPSGVKSALVNRSGSGYATGSTAFTPVQWNNEVYDTDGFHDNSTNPSRITIPSGTSGLIRLSASISASGSTSELGIAFFKNGTQITNYEYDTENSTGNISAISAPITCTAGDYFEVAIRATSAPTVDVSNNSWFAVEELPSGLNYTVGSWTTTSLTSGSFIQIRQLTVPAGVTRIQAGFWAGKIPTTGTFAMVLRKNGADFTEGAMCQSNSAGSEYVHAMSVPFTVTPGDTIEVYGYANAGAQSCVGFMWIEEVPTVT